MKNLLQTCFERRTLLKMANRHSYYNKKISWSRHFFQKTDIMWESVYLRTIDRKLTLNLIVISNSFTDISFIKYVTKIFYISYYFYEKIDIYYIYYIYTWYILYQLKELISCKYSTRTLENVQGNFSTKDAVLECIPSNFFLEIYRNSSTTAKKLSLENYVLAYHTANKDHAKIL